MQGTAFSDTSRKLAVLAGTSAFRISLLIGVSVATAIPTAAGETANRGHKRPAAKSSANPGQASHPPAHPEKDPRALSEPPQEFVIDAVVASVNDKPITLSDLCSRLTPPRKLAFRDAVKDQEAQQVLDALILEKLLEEESASKHLSATDTEVEDYINEVASRNGLSRPDFEKALAGEGKDLTSYKRQVRLDILKTKLASSLSRGGVSVSDTEIDQYIADHPDFTRSGVSLRLRQILISTTERSEDDMKTRLALIMEDLKSGKDFGEIARHYSDGPEAAEGGVVGLVAEKDLSSEVFDAVFALKVGSYSKPIPTAAGVQIFFVEQRIGRKDGDEDEEVSEEEQEEALRAEVRKLLQQQKTQEKLSSYFVSDLYKNHTVDKKM